MFNLKMWLFNHTINKIIFSSRKVTANTEKLKILSYIRQYIQELNDAQLNFKILSYILHEFTWL